jgi:hypothetical protein
MNLLDPVLHLHVLGVVFFVHAVFPARFDWRRELPALSLINQQLMTVHTFFIAVVVLGIGVVCLVDAEPLVATPLGRHVCVGLSVFWGLRFLAQHFWYSPRLWRGKVFETVVHVAFSLLWAWATAVFAFVGSGRAAPWIAPES